MTKVYKELSPKVKSKSSKVRKRALNVLDSCISLFIVSPLVVGFWKGLWNNINRFDDEYKIFPVWKWLAISYTVSSLIYYARDYLNVTIMSGSESHVESIYLKGLRRHVLYRLFHYLFAFSSIMIWRCLWEIGAYFWGESRVAVCLSLSRNICILIHLFSAHRWNEFIISHNRVCVLYSFSRDGRVDDVINTLLFGQTLRSHRARPLRFRH
jgi:hypothetical protein